MELSDKSSASIESLISSGLFKNSEEAIEGIIEYAYGIESFEEIELELDSEGLDYLKSASDKTGAPVNFILNRIVRRYLENESSN